MLANRLTKPMRCIRDSGHRRLCILDAVHDDILLHVPMVYATMPSPYIRMLPNAMLLRTQGNMI